MASSYEAFQDLQLTRDEVERITDALKDKNFRKLLTDYVDEIRDPENQKIYQKEITQLEKERGVDITFINPVAGYVIKTSVDGCRKTFINICANEHVDKPSAEPTVKEGSKGLQWKLPHTLAPPRDDVDKKGKRCQVYDVVFHPDTLHLAHKNKTFREMVNKTACDAVESSFEVSLDRNNLKFPKLQYKGYPRAAVIRKPSENPPEISPEEKEIMEKLFAAAEDCQPKHNSPKKSKKPKKNEDEQSAYTTPNYVIKHRRHIELEEFTDDRNCKMNTALPKEIVVEVILPLLRSSSEIILDVTEKSLQLVSEKPAKYKLSLTLPYRVNQDIGNAKFDKDLKKLVVTLPVKTKPSGLTVSDVTKDDSGVESDHGSVTSSSPVEEIITPVTDSNFESKAEKKTVSSFEAAFLDPNVYYSLPEFTSHVFENTIAFTLNVKNVDVSSISYVIGEDAGYLHLKFSSISSGFYPQHYAFFIDLGNYCIDTSKLSIETWDNNVIVQISYTPCDTAIRSYFYGADQDSLTQKYVEEPSIINEVLEESVKESAKEFVKEESKGAEKKEDAKKSKKDRKKAKASAVLQESTETEVTETEEDEEKTSDDPSELLQTLPIDIVRGSYESSGDEISHSFSPTKGRGILKGSCSSRRFGRSISESGLDDVNLSSSAENCHTSVDSVIPEEGELSTSLKKTVRFNDVVSRQLFRSNSSILGQRKKNQRKAKAKKRAQERRYSESEVSESENKEERELETARSEGDKNGNNEAPIEEKCYFASDIFQLDMN